MIPRVQFVSHRRWILALVSALLIGFWVSRHTLAAQGGTVVAGAWMLFLASIVWHLALAWSARPATVTARQERALSKLFIAVSVPVYNEDPRTLRLVVCSLFAQTRLPDRVQIVDDGSTQYDYADVIAEARSLAAFYPQVEFAWTRTANGGKRHAQAIAFNDGGQADIFVTLDSDSVLDADAIQEGLKPFADPAVASVATTMLLYNAGRNILTRLTDLWMTTFQTFIKAAWSRLGCVLVNSGSLAFYRADVIRGALPAYTSETFFGQAVQFSDDSLLTLYAHLSGRTVQQPTSFVFTVMPEKIGHHLRQQLRWMRGSFIRAWWRFRYLPLRGIAFWEHLLMWVTFTLGTTLLAGAFITGPLLHARPPGLVTSLMPLLLMYAAASPVLMMNRDDQRMSRQLVTFFCTPLVCLWMIIVLRPLRLYAMATCRHTGWGTRARIEVGPVEGT
jgi:hyaluronan synthase